MCNGQESKLQNVVGNKEHGIIDTNGAEPYETAMKRETSYVTSNERRDLAVYSCCTYGGEFSYIFILCVKHLKKKEVRLAGMSRHSARD